MTSAPDNGITDASAGLEDDLRPRIAALLARGETFALATISDADGGPRRIGSQMVVTAAESWGFVSGGCIEGDVALHARATLTDGEARRLVYGVGSPWADIRLPCGGRLDLLVERVNANDPAIAAYVEAYERRKSIRYQTDGKARRCVAPDQDDLNRWTVDCVYEPAQRLVVIGSDPIALAIALMGARQGWAVDAIWPGVGFDADAKDVRHWNQCPAEAIAAIAPDRFCAVAIATHDRELDEEAILACLPTQAGYIGVLGARRRIADRVAALERLGVGRADIARLHMPIGVAVGSSPWEIAVSVCAEIVGERRASRSL